MLTWFYKLHVFKHVAAQSILSATVQNLSTVWMWNLIRVGLYFYLFIYTVID